MHDEKDAGQETVPGFLPRQRKFDPRWSFFVGNWWVTFGWYASEPFALLRIGILEMLEGCDQVETVSVIDVQFTRLAFAAGFNR